MLHRVKDVNCNMLTLFHIGGAGVIDSPLRFSAQGSRREGAGEKYSASDLCESYDSSNTKKNAARTTDALFPGKGIASQRSIWGRAFVPTTGPSPPGCGRINSGCGAT